MPQIDRPRNVDFTSATNVLIANQTGKHSCRNWQFVRARAGIAKQRRRWTKGSLRAYSYMQTRTSAGRSSSLKGVKLRALSSAHLVGNCRSSTLILRSNCRRLLKVASLCLVSCGAQMDAHGKDLRSFVIHHCLRLNLQSHFRLVPCSVFRPSPTKPPIVWRCSEDWRHHDCESWGVVNAAFACLTGYGL